ncbi:MAG TPA: hypothetical protein VMU28_02365 [Terriglobales bacterium]|nr:hypothetical protein [Terriglobales bacterium]
MGELTEAPSAGVETQTDPAEVAPGFGGGSGAAGGNFAPLCGPCAIATVTVGHEACGAGLGSEPELLVPEALEPELELEVPEPEVVPELEVEEVLVTPPVDVACGLPPQPTCNSAKTTSGRTGETAIERPIRVDKEPPQLGIVVVRNPCLWPGCNRAGY